MLNLSDWERKNSASSPVPDLTVIFPSREIYFSRSLLSMMRFTADTCPKTLDQWYELCHPEDHAKISQLERALSGRENFLTLTRKLYCGDGQCRTFRLDAYIHRDKSGSPSRLTGRETPSLGAWLETAEDGDVIECTDPDGRVRVLEAIRIQGVMTLRDKGEIEDLQQENIRLRREIQRRIFAPSPSAFTPTPQETSSHLRSSLEESLTLSLNVLTGNAPLKALRRAMSEPALTVGILGLTGSGKTSLMNALLGENLIPEQSRTAANIPILCREGESRHARIYYQDGRVEDVRGDKLTRSYVKDLTHGSTAGIARFEAVIPGALIPEGLCFVDTPGFDALSGSGGAALRNILPELDVIIYVTPIRAAFKGSDYDSLRTILAVNKRIIFVLSQTDLERDDTEAGRVIISSQAKILADISRLKRDMKSFCGQDFDVIPVSSRLALEKFYDRKSPEWLASNIEGVVNYFAGHDPYSMALRLRAERMITLLDGALSDKKLTGSSRWRLQDYSNNIRNALKGQASLPETFGSCTYTCGPKPHDKGGKNLLSSLITSLREHEFRNRFFALPAFGRERYAVLLGADKSQSLKLYARLSHNIASERLPDGEVSVNEWLCAGRDSPFGSIALPVISPGENILIAPPDSDLAKNIDWHKLFRKFTPVVSVDLARIDSGLSDLAHAPYLTGLALYSWVLAFGNAGMFDTRQLDLVSKIPERVKEFAEVTGLKSPDWFIYENYRIF